MSSQCGDVAKMKFFEELCIKQKEKIDDLQLDLDEAYEQIKCLNDEIRRLRMGDEENKF
jgi:hypothetical protein